MREITNNLGVKIASIATLVGMLIMSVVLYEERTVFLDIAYHIFTILQTDEFAIQNHRIGAFFTQFFPLLGSKLGISLQSIAMWYSMSFVLLPILVMSYLLFGIKNTRLALAYLLFLVLITKHTFFWIQSELGQGMAFLFLFIALFEDAMMKGRFSQKNVAVLLFLLVFVVFTHPLLVFPFFFYLGFKFLQYPTWKKYLFRTAAAFFLVTILKSVFFRTQYDNQAFGSLAKNFLKYFPNFWDIPSNKELLHLFVSDYYFAPLLLVAIIIYYLSKRAYLRTAFIVIFFLAYSLIVNLTYPEGAETFYLENQYLVLSFIVGIPFATDVFPKSFKFRWQIFCLVLIVFAFFWRLGDAYNIYHRRLEWNEKFLAKTENANSKKLLVASCRTPEDVLLMNWASCYEFWLLSTMKTGESRSIIILDDIHGMDWALPATHSFISRWGSFPYEEFNPKYFVFKDTTAYVKEICN